MTTETVTEHGVLDNKLTTGMVGQVHAKGYFPPYISKYKTFCGRSQKT